MTKNSKIYSMVTFTIVILLASRSSTFISLPSSSTAHSPIYIDGNAELDAFCAGNGTDGLSWETAHVIEDYEINGGDPASFALLGIDRYLIIQNCDIINSVHSALVFDTCENINITECEFKDGRVQLWGSQFIYVYDSEILDSNLGLTTNAQTSNITITRNTFSTSSFGMELSCDDSTISYNTGNTTGSYGIYLDSECENNEVCYNCFEGEENFLGIVNEREGNNIHDNGCRPSIPGYSIGIIIASVVGIATVILAVTKKRSKK